MPENRNTKEDILQQLYNNVAVLWGVHDVENLDPLVKILIQGLASLISDIHGELREMNVRILDSLADTLAPSVLTAPCPAHAVAQAFPTNPVVIIDRKHAFNDKHMPQELREKGIKNLPFFPVMRTRLVSGKMKYLICERNFYLIEANGEKRLSGQAHTLGEKTNHTVWIGMDLHPEVETLQSLSFFFDFPHAAGKQDKFSVLPYSRWDIDGRTLDMKAGLPFLQNENEDEILFPEHGLLNRTDKNIAELYNRQFLTVSTDFRLSEVRREPFPAAIADLFPEHVTARTEPCHWIRAVFPAYITMQDIHDMTVHINVFPVAQKVLYSVSHDSGRGLTGIVPLKTQYEGEYLIGMEQVTDSFGDLYMELPRTAGGGHGQAGTYAVKRGGGVERFDRRSASEALERVIDLLRDEAAAFSSRNRDRLRDIVNAVQDGLKRLEIAYGDNPARGFSMPDYLILDKPDREGDEREDTLFVEYWTTHCEAANGLRAGKILEPAASLPLVKDSCRLTSATRGGKFPADATDRMNAFRHTLTSRDGLVTREDIINFLHYELGNKITRVRVTKGVAVSPKPKEGLVRTIDIHLTPSRGCESIIAEMQDDLLVMLRSKSPDLYNFRIMVEDKN
jgi:hypothetical protein